MHTTPPETSRTGEGETATDGGATEEEEGEEQGKGGGKETTGGNSLMTIKTPAHSQCP